MNRIEAHEFAANWISAWNRRDVDAVLEHYIDDATFVSPKAVGFVGKPVVHERKHFQNIGKLLHERSKLLNSSWIILSGTPIQTNWLFSMRRISTESAAAHVK